MSTTERYDAIVIGAGHNGLVAASYLAKAGRRVVVVERSASAGGCATTEELWPGTSVDIGAGGLTEFDPRVASDLGLFGRGLTVDYPDPALVAPQPDREAIVLGHDLAASAASIQRWSERDAARWPDFVAAMAEARRVLGVLYATTPPRIAGAGSADLWELARMAGRLGRVGRREAIELMRLLPMTIEELLDEWFDSEALKGALAFGGIRGICQGPMASGTAYVFLHNLLPAVGAAAYGHVRGGMGELGASLEAIANERGCALRYEASVAEIRSVDERVVGVTLASGEVIDAPLVLSSIDPGSTFGLVDPGELSPEFRGALNNIKYRGVTARVHLRLNADPGLDSQGEGPHRALMDGATIVGCPSIKAAERAYDAAKYGRASERPVFEARFHAATDSTSASRVLSVTAQYAPYRLRAGDWDEANRNAFGDDVVRQLETCFPGIGASVEAREVLTPKDLSDRFGLTEGSIHHGELTLDQVFIGRPVPGWARYETPIAGLYACGAGTHPGGGLNGRPGAAAARAVLSADR